MFDSKKSAGMEKSKLAPLALMAFGLLMAGCGKPDAEGKSSQAKAKAAQEAPAEDPALSKGVGPIKTLELAPLDLALAEKGEKAFSGTCSACHKMEQRYVGPAMAGVTKRRTPEWIMNMILNPTGMTQQDPTAKALLAEYMTQMSVSSTEEDARAILEYFRKIDG